jgi:teichuronic acid biosynthesis glycosyltransferase TuaC
VRALVVSNMLPDALHPERGRFVRDQVAALGELEGLDVELFEFPPGARGLARASLQLARRFRAPGARRRSAAAAVDVVHAHFGLTAWPALAVPARARALTVHGTDLSHPRTRLATRAVLPSIDLLAAVSEPLRSALPGRGSSKRALVLPCGVDLARFRPLPRASARQELGLDAGGPYVLFPADPARAEKRHDRALSLARAAGVELLTLGGVPPEKVALWINAANCVLVPSEREGFGLSVLEALACDVPVLATPVGIHEQVLHGIDGTLCAPFETSTWQAALAAHLRAADPRVDGRARAEEFSAPKMAERVAGAWRATLDHGG